MFNRTFRLSSPHLRLVIGLGVGCLLSLGSAQAQRDIEIGSNAAPLAPDGLVIPPLPKETRLYDTAEGMDIHVEVLARGLVFPWSIALLPNGDALISERNAGRLRLLRNGVLHPDPVAEMPAVARSSDLSGLLDLGLHPDFEDNGLLYFTYSKPLEDGAAIALGRGRWDGDHLRDIEDLFVADPGTGATSRLSFGGDGMVYFSLFGIDEAAQDPMAHQGKVLRLTPEGDIPDDNPFIDTAGYRPEIYTLGHRSISGMTTHPLTGEVWVVEMGPQGGDELNRLEAGGNYGWPTVSLGRTYPGPWHSNAFQQDGLIDPVLYWTPSISVSGLTFYQGDALPAWKGDLFVGGLRYAQTPGTGRLQRTLINLEMEELRREDLLLDLRRRIRDVRAGPDGFLYVLTDDEDGAVLCLRPAH